MLVYDGERKDVMLVEVKMRRAKKETSVMIFPQRRLDRIANYKEFWNDSILLLVVPSGSVFFAQRVNEFEIKPTYNLARDFENLEDLFTRVAPEDLSFYRTEALKIMET